MGAHLAPAVGAVSSAYHPHRDRLHLDDMEGEGSCMHGRMVHLDGDRLCTNYSYPLFLSTALQRMVIDCAHYVAQLIWVIGETNNKQLLV